MQFGLAACLFRVDDLLIGVDPFVEDVGAYALCNCIHMYFMLLIWQLHDEPKTQFTPRAIDQSHNETLDWL